MADRQKSAGRNAADGSNAGYTKEERAAMRERARELKAQRQGAEGEADVLAKIAEMPDHDRSIAERLHALIKEAAPDLTSRTWYGMPAYAKGGKVVCFFQSAAKFGARYATLGFTDEAHLDEGTLWATSFALKELTPSDEERVVAMVKRAAG